MSKYWYLTAGKMKVVSLGLLILSVLAVNAHAQSILGNASTFAVLGGSEVTNVSPSVITTGNVGVAPATSITGFNSISGLAVSDPQVLAGTVQSDTAGAIAAQGSLTTALTDLGALSSVATTVLNGNLTGLVLAPGVYSVAAGTTNLAGTLTLAGTGSASDTWVFLMPSTLITSTGSTVVTTDSVGVGNVFWDVGSSATIQSGTTFYGNILASTSISMVTGATDSCGSALASTGAVTLEMNTISTGCNLGVTATTTSGGVTTVSVPTPGGTITATVPEGGSTLLYLCSFLLPLGAMRAFRFRRSI
jgi:hypothetical protein